MHVLATAFIDDPLMTYFWPDRNRRRRALPNFWSSRLEARRRSGLIDTRHDEYGALASVVLWEPAGVIAPTVRYPSLVRALGTALPRALAASRRIDALRPEYPHLYIAVGATVPHLTGRGLAASMLRPRIETSAVDSFFVATNPASASIGRHLGFEQVGELKIGHIVLTALLRKAA